MKLLSWLVTLLLIIGGINWGLVGLMKLDLVQYFMGGTGIDRIAYIVVGVAGVWRLVECYSYCKSCS